ncbi:MAG: PKD domain-containing protein, partial [Methanobacteriota archaeon]
MMKRERRFGILIVCMMMTAAVFATVPLNVSAQNEPTADAGGPYTAPEGTAILFNASGSTDPNGDPLNYSWDFNNDGVWDTAYSPDPTAVYTWYDDYTGIVVVNVTDGVFNDTDTADVTVTNVDPDPHGGDYGPVDEGEMIPFDVFFTDPGSDMFTSTGMLDGLSHMGRPNLVLDSVDYGSFIIHATLHTNEYEVNDLELEALYGSINSLTVFGTINIVPSPGIFYTHQFSPNVPEDTQVSMDILMEDEFVSMCQNQSRLWALQWHITFDGDILSSGFFSNITQNCSLQFDKGISDDCGQLYHIFNYTVMDDDGGIGTHLVQIEVRNVDPDVDAGPDQTVFVGDAVQFVGSFTDPGWLDTH